jgi:acyl carrier protein
MKLTLDNLAAIIAERFNIDPAAVLPEATLDELGFDSLSMVDLAVLLEKKAKIFIIDKKLNDISTIADILAAAAADEERTADAVA